MNAASKPGMSSADAGKAQLEVMSSLEKECSVNGLRCDVVTLYSGALYHLYKYKRYSDIRLVMAPEFTIAFFGGDPDNFEYPRYDLDISFFRAYENDQPAKDSSDYLKWSKTGIKDGDLVFVPGHPGRTGRLLTMDQLAFLRDVQYPWQLKSLKDAHRHAADLQCGVAGKRTGSAKRRVWPAKRLQGDQRLSGWPTGQAIDGEESG